MNERFGWSCEKYNYDNNNMISKISQKYLTGILYGLLSKIREDINLSQTQGNINFYKIFYDNLNCLYDSFNIKNKKNKTIN